MAAGIRKQGESFKAYRARLNGEQQQIDRAAEGVMVFESYVSKPWPTLYAIRSGKLNRKSGRRLATSYGTQQVA